MVDFSQPWTVLAIIALAALAVLVIAILIASGLNRRRTKALLRFDWYLPVLRKPKPGRESHPGWLHRAAARCLPSALLSDPTTKRRGLFRKALRKLGISWLASPIRRASQAACLITFLVLFLIVCWPYDARPRSAGWTSDGWTFTSLDQSSGALRFTRNAVDDALSPVTAAVGAEVYLSEQATGPVGSDVAYATTLVELEGLQLTVQPSGPRGDALLDRLLSGGLQRWRILENDPHAWPSHYSQNLARKELLPAELFLAIDPLVSLSTAIASRSWVWSLISAAVILLVCVFIPRGFCGYLCPLGTTIDLFDWAIGRRVTRFRVSGDGWWVHVKYYLLAATLIAALFGVLVSGFVSAIPVITRACLIIVDPLQSGALRGWHLVPAMNVGHFVSLALFACVLGLGFFQPRFWCKYVCPSGAVFSLGNLFRATERKVESSCIHCNKCVEICPFDAIKPDFTTRETDCTLCQSCAGVCPTHAIKFVERGNRVELKVLNDPPTGETVLGRRGFLSLASGSAAAIVGGAAVAGITKSYGASLGTGSKPLPVRPPGSVPEQEFLEMCIRCGECFKVCPNNVLQVQGFEQGLEGLWTPVVKADWAGCESSCNACGQVCPTGAIRALPLEEKRVARMGLAIVNQETCLPLAGKEECDLCVQECISAGYDAIEFLQVGTQVDDAGNPIEGTGFLAPVVLDDKCVGCGLCQTRCYGINVKQRHVLSASAIIVEAGDGHEDRLMQGSYRELRQIEEAARKKTVSPSNAQAPVAPPPAVSVETEPDFGDNPFGLDTP